jgi:ABC-2 type transport system permease protein
VDKLSNSSLKKHRSVRILYLNELKKCVNAKTTFAVFLIIIVGLVFFALQLNSQPEQVDYDNAQIFLQYEIDSINDTLNDPSIGMSNEMRESYLNTLKIDKYLLEHGIAPYKTHSITNYLLSLNNLFALVVMLSVIVVSKIITDEYKYSTLNILITVPCKRYKILLSKILAMITICISIILSLYLMSIIVGALFFDAGELSSVVVTYSNNVLHVRSVIIESLLNNFYNVFTLIGCASLTLMLSIVLKSGIISTCAGICVYLLGSRLTIALKELPWIKYTLFANMQFQMYVSGVDLFDGVTPTFSIVVLMLYSLLFLMISFIVFEKRNVYE